MCKYLLYLILKIIIIIIQMIPGVSLLFLSHFQFICVFDLLSVFDAK